MAALRDDTRYFHAVAVDGDGREYDVRIPYRITEAAECETGATVVLGVEVVGAAHVTPRGADVEQSEARRGLDG